MLIDPYRFAVAGGGGDPYFANVVLLCHFEGSDGSTTFVDSSSFVKTITADGSAALEDTDPLWGLTSLLTPGDGTSRARVAMDADLDLSTASSWTVECWISTTDNTIFGNLPILQTITDAFTFPGSGFRLDWHGPLTRLSFSVLGTGATSGAYSSAVMGIGDKHHVALVCNGATSEMQCFWDGIGSGAVSIAGGPFDAFAAPYFSMGGSENGPIFGVGWPGRTDEVRVTREVVRYWADFTPETPPFPDA